jgi:hypothetical protein
MRREIFLSIFIAALISLAAACGGGTSDNSNSTSNANGGNTNAGNHAQMPIPHNDEPTENNAPTLAPVVQQFYDALRDKDDAKLKETLTAKFEKTLEDDMKSENEKSLAAFVAKTDYRPGQVIETRNEKINGDKAVAEIKGGAYKNWTSFEFAKENGKWKFTGGSPEIDNVPKTNTNSVSPH